MAMIDRKRSSPETITDKRPLDTDEEGPARDTDEESPGGEDSFQRRLAEEIKHPRSLQEHPDAPPRRSTGSPRTSIRAGICKSA
jgi:hypothetical protein